MKITRNFAVNNIISYTLDIPEFTKSSIDESHCCGLGNVEASETQNEYIQMVERNFTTKDELETHLKSDLSSIGEILTLTEGGKKYRWIINPHKSLTRLLLDQKVYALKTTRSPIVLKYDRPYPPTVWFLEDNLNKLFNADVQLMKDNFISIYWDEELTGTIFVF